MTDASTNFTRGDVGGFLGDARPIDAVYGDSDTGIFIAKQLQLIETQVYERPFQPNPLLDVIQINTSGGAGLGETGFYEESGRARFKRMGDASADFDLADLKRKERLFPILPYISGYSYWMREFERAQRVGISLDTRKAMYCRKAYEDLLELHCLVGEPEEGVYGLLNAPEIENRATLATAFSTSTTATDLLDGLVDIVDSVTSESEDTARIPTDLFVPGPLFRYARRLFFGSGEQVSVRDRFEDITGCSLRPVERLKSIDSQLVDASASSGTDSFAIAGVFDAMSHQKQVPVPFQQMRPHVRSAGLETVIPCRTEIGGLHIYEPCFAVRENVWSS